jgi:MFS transporter, FHS family, Na+ dependent glucose transporter 1
MNRMEAAPPVGERPALRPMATTFAYYGAFIGLGLISASLGPTLPGLAALTGTELGSISILFMTRSTGYMLGSLLGGRFFDRLPGHQVMAAALVIMGLGMITAPTLPILWALALALMTVGIAEGAVDVGGNTLIVWVHRAKVGPYMNALHFCFGLGAFISPIVVAQAIVYTGGIRWAYWLLALYVVPITLVLLRLASPTSLEVRRSDGSRSGTSNPPLVALIAVFMFLYVGAEVAMGGWLYTYALTLGLAGETSAAYLTSVFWGALTLGRLAAIPVAARFRPRVILWADLIGCLASAVLMIALPTQAWALWAGAFGMGLSMASIFPTVIIWAERRMTMRGSVASWFLVGASLGAMFLPWFIGQLFEPIGPHITMWVVFIDLILTVALFMVLLAYGGPAKTAEE